MTRKRTKSAPSAMPPSTLPSLPLSVFSLVMEFAVYGYSQDLFPAKRSHPREHLKDVAMVSKSWLQPVKQLMKQYEQETMEIHLETGAKEEIIAIQIETAARCGAVRDLRITIGKEKNYSYGTHKFMLLTKEMEEMLVDWNVLIAKMPGLRRLDLKLVPLQSKHLPELLKAAGKYCSHLESLVLPRKAELKEAAKGEKVEAVLKELYRVLEQVHLKGYRGGLRQLTVPTRNDAERHQSSKEFLENVAKYCPNIEHLDGSEHSFHDYEGVRCEDKWMVSLDTWEEFNKTCSSLREFHWASVPFADPFFHVFGANLKPELETLGVTANLLWNWKEYLQVCGAATAEAIQDCYGRRAKEIAVIFKSCPSLKNLTVEIDLQKYTDSSARHFKIDSFGDKFWASVATNCPRLERFAIRNCANFEVMNVRPIRTFTDASLVSLAELKDLYSVESNAAVMCTGDGIFDYMRRVLELNCYSNNWRMLDLRIGGQQNGFFGVPMFYSVVVGLLRCLAEVNEKDFGAAACKQKFEVFLSNPYHSRVSKQWSSIYMREELRPLMYRVKETHPSLSLNASVNGVSGDTFSKIDMFTLSWRPRDRERDMFWNSAEDEYYCENDPSDRMPPALMNLFNELLGYNSQGGGSASSGDEDGDVEGNGEDDFGGFYPVL
ncbi:hypothetical protein F441_14376 [Phytophthora nicotianae CJ01A1]|uniref:Uncharacterized protein n=3 Tax=Phytophthora nicotianae TaxID=4792 RepID=W2GAR7_PHYNI|nr:hypothetical protein L915_14141 [Phytophthora nicotianae]ETL86816.1 hypothetical protein L917_13829 [Phytophthora nicotianae]ETP09842.1 hypothetical protein F441_14376 [Phytophthora nicotianae CJ01A1]